MYIRWVLMIVAVCAKRGSYASDGDAVRKRLTDAVNNAKRKVEQHGDVSPPVVNKELCLQLTLLSAVYRVHHYSDNLWRTERDITLLEKRIGEEQNARQKQKLENELQLLQEYKKILVKNEGSNKQRLLDLLGRDLNNLEEPLKTLGDLEELQALQVKLPDFPRDACKKYNDLWNLKTAVDALRSPEGSYDCEGKSQIEIHLREFNLFLLSFFSKELLEFLCAEIRAQATYLDVARRTLGVVNNPQEFRKKLFNNQNPNVQSVLYKIHYMSSVEKCSDAEIQEALNKCPNDNSVAALEELLKNAYSNEQQNIMDQLKKEREGSDNRLATTSVEATSSSQPGQVTEKKQKAETEAQTAEAVAAEEENKARQATEETRAGETEQQSQQQDDDEQGTSEPRRHTTDETPEETQQESQQKADDEQKEEVPEQKEPEYEQWAEDWPWVRRCDPPSRTLRLSEYMVKQGFGTGWYAEDAKPVPKNENYPIGALLSRS